MDNYADFTQHKQDIEREKSYSAHFAMKYELMLSAFSGLGEQ